MNEIKLVDEKERKFSPAFNLEIAAMVTCCYSSILMAYRIDRRLRNIGVKPQDTAYAKTVRHLKKAHELLTAGIGRMEKGIENQMNAAVQGRNTYYDLIHAEANHLCQFIITYFDRVQIHDEKRLKHAVERFAPYDKDGQLEKLLEDYQPEEIKNIQP